ncbi:MAG TPA: aspartate kinase [Chitinophagaceae bacterium]|nr:aspartate kinase [Chitinophagaceae bacterium]
MQVFKFGGASVNSVERIKNVAAILRAVPEQPILIVISAMGKTTNALEKVVDAFYQQQKELALQLFEQVKNQHLTTAKYLLVHNYLSCEQQLRDFFTEVEWLLHDSPVRGYDYYYDQVVCAGELFSTAIVSAYLNEEGIANQWLDVRDVFRTDDNFRDANIDISFTQRRVTETVLPLFSQQSLVITQGFIGATDENESTTLGREGSDYSAAIFANLLAAKNLTIWKDVEGVMNADPKLFPDAQLISELNYDEIIEMAYYGAQVIHPKTIKPLQNKDIPLHVKCFLDASLPGTVVHNKNIASLPPIIVLKENQALVHLHTQDFSFIGEAPMSRLYEIFAAIKVKPNLIQTGAVSLVVCLDDRADKIDALALTASEMFEVMVEKGLTILTIRHYKEALLLQLVGTRKTILRQQTEDTVQVLLKA